MLWLYQRMFTGVPDEATAKMKDVNLREVLVVAPLILLSLFIGLYPKPVLDRVEPTVKRVMTNFERKTDYREPKAPKLLDTLKSEPGKSKSGEEGK